MQKFIERTTKPVLIIGGGLTATAGLNAFLPRFTVETVQKLEFVPTYTVFVQHWGMMVFLMGVLMVVAAFRPSWRTPILIYGAVEKAFMVALVLANWGAPFVTAFLVPAVMDALIVAWILAYFWASQAGADAKGDEIPVAR